MDATCVSITNALGVKCDGKPLPDFAELRNDVAEKKMTGLFRTGWQMDYPSMQNFLAPLYATGTPAPTTVATATRSSTTCCVTPQARPRRRPSTSYQKAEAILAKEMPVIPLWYGALTAGWSENINTPQFTPFARVDLTSLTPEVVADRDHLGARHLTRGRERRLLPPRRFSGESATRGQCASARG